jgi:triphosphoribosyl-dephospho-CoA synthase
MNLGGVFTPEGRAALAEMDRELRDENHAMNPGTTADLTAAAIFLALLGVETG